MTREPLLQFGKALLEGRAAVERTRLVRGPGAKLRIPRACREVGVGLIIGYALDRPFDTDLSPQRLPVEEHRGRRVVRELLPF